MMKVLFVDDDADVRLALGQSLQLAGYETTLCKAFIEAIDHLSPGYEGIVVTDMRMPGRDGFDLLARAQKVDADIPVIILTGEGDIPMAVKAVSKGAYDFIEKPCSPKRLIEAVARACEKRALVLQNRRLQGRNSAIASARDRGQAEPLSIQMEMVEKLLIEAALRDHAGKVVTAAKTLGLPRKTLYDKLKRHGIEAADFRSVGP